MMWDRIKNKVKIFLSILAVYISATGLVTFSEFITEESIQTAMFGTWQAIEGKDWEMVKFGCERIKEGDKLLKSLNYSLGWIQPFSFLAYNAYGNATDAYIQGLEARIFANAPELYDGKTMTFAFTAQSTTKGPEGYVHTSGKVSFISPTDYSRAGRKRVTGTVSVDGEKVVVREVP
jgi:hypothetical protein